MNVNASASDSQLMRINLGSTGRFRREPGAFEIYGSPARPWQYIYTTDKLLLRVSDRGPISAQCTPPGGLLLFARGKYDSHAPLQLFCMDDGDQSSLSAFSHSGETGVERTVNFTPSQACYVARNSTFELSTTLGIAVDDTAIYLRSTLRNTSNEVRRIRFCAVCHIMQANAVQAPWDMPELYQTCGFTNAPTTGIYMHSRDPEGRRENHKYSMFSTSFPPEEAEIVLRDYTGSGSCAAPAALHKRRWRIQNDHPADFLLPQAEDCNVGTPGVAALRSRIFELAPGETCNCSYVLYLAHQFERETAVAEFETKIPYFLDHVNQEREANALEQIIRRWQNCVSYKFADGALSEYLNGFLPLQLYFVGRLDRGWPSNMRGVRDAAQDYSGISIVEPEAARELLLKILACQKSDGGFLRQFSASGPDGNHDHRDYVDSGCWVIEFFYDYLRYTGDFAILDQCCRTLEDSVEIPVRTHLTMAINYYLAEWNRGEHNLVLIRQGDWNDAMNTAGLLLRGESVMVSAHVVFLLGKMAEILPENADFYYRKAEELRKDIRAHALNRSGFLNGVFNDDGLWLFSDHDPDHVSRVNSAINSFGVIAGIFQPDELPVVFAALRTLRGPNGFRLFYPPLGNPPIAHAGRLGSGDLCAGLCENGTVYNHGSQGFLLRAAAIAGERELIAELLRFILPYDQTTHPVERAKSEPYAIVNSYSESRINFGEGGMPFLSGTISTLYRVMLENITGFQAGLHNLKIAPQIPDSLLPLTVDLVFRNYRMKLQITCGTPNGQLFVDGQACVNNCLQYDKLHDGIIFEYRMS